MSVPSLYRAYRIGAIAVALSTAAEALSTARMESIGLSPSCSSELDDAIQRAQAAVKRASAVELSWHDPA